MRIAAGIRIRVDQHTDWPEFTPEELAWLEAEARRAREELAKDGLYPPYIYEWERWQFVLELIRGSKSNKTLARLAWAWKIRQEIDRTTRERNKA